MDMVMFSSELHDIGYHDVGHILAGSSAVCSVEAHHKI